MSNSHTTEDAILLRLEALEAEKKVRQCMSRYMLLCDCLLYTSPSPRDLSTSRMPSSA